MKRTIAALATTVLLSVGAGATYAVAAGTPEIDPAAANLQLSPTAPFTARTCAGEDGAKYVTFRGNWAGAETAAPLSTDYVLTGGLKISRVVWTINLTTLRGVLKGTASFQSAAGIAGPGDDQPATYTGPVTLITQGLPASATGAPAFGRGWLVGTLANINAPAPNPGTLLANVEVQVNGFAVTGEFGNTMNLPDWSVATNNMTC
jgi:hypothetical protein